MRNKSVFAVLFSSLLLITSCKHQDFNYAEYEHVNNVNFFDKISSKYAVYVYSEHCGHCNNLKEYISAYIHSAHNSETPLYLYDVDANENKFLNYVPDSSLSTEQNMEKCFELSKNATSIDQLYLYGTPTIYELSFNDIGQISYLSDEFIGETNIKNFLTKSSIKLPILISLTVVAGVFLTGVTIYMIYKKKKGA